MEIVEYLPPERPLLGNYSNRDEYYADREHDPHDDERRKRTATSEEINKRPLKKLQAGAPIRRVDNPFNTPIYFPGHGPPPPVHQAAPLPHRAAAVPTYEEPADQLNEIIDGLQNFHLTPDAAQIVLYDPLPSSPVLTTKENIQLRDTLHRLQNVQRVQEQKKRRSERSVQASKTAQNLSMLEEAPAATKNLIEKVKAANFDFSDPTTIAVIGGMFLLIIVFIR
jgi:hypothetical protein